MEIKQYSKIKNLKILLVDDDDFAMRIIRHILYGLGITHINEAFDGENAQKQLANHICDLLITDVQMPKMNGLELLKRIRCGQTNARRELPAIIITSLSNSEVLRTSLALDVNGFLVKPMKPVVVEKKISAAMSESNKIAVRPTSDYESVVTDLKSVDGSTDKKTGVNASILIEQQETTTHATVPRESNRISIQNLKPGMRITNDVRLNDGTLLISAGYRLRETTIYRLHDLREVLKDELISIEEPKE